MQKGFPLDYKIGDIEKVLRPYGNLQSVVMRRVAGPDRLFKVSFDVYFREVQCDRFVSGQCLRHLCDERGMRKAGRGRTDHSRRLHRAADQNAPVRLSAGAVLVWANVLPLQARISPSEERENEGTARADEG